MCGHLGAANLHGETLSGRSFITDAQNPHPKSWNHTNLNFFIIGWDEITPGTRM